MRRRILTWLLILTVLGAAAWFVVGPWRPRGRLAVDCAAAARARAAAPDELRVEGGGGVRDSEVGKAWDAAVRDLAPSAQEAVRAFAHVLRVPDPDDAAPPEAVALMPPGWTHEPDASRFLAYRRLRTDGTTVVYGKLETSAFASLLRAHAKPYIRAWAEGMTCE